VIDRKQFLLSLRAFLSEAISRLGRREIASAKNASQRLPYIDFSVNREEEKMA